jgi:hypothetical protein
MHWVIKNKEGQLLKYLYGGPNGKAVFNEKKDRAYRVYTFAKESTLNKTLEILKGFGWDDCEAVPIENESEHENFNCVQERKGEEAAQVKVDFEKALSEADELTEGYHKYCRVCTRGCKLSERNVFYGPCPLMDFRSAA